MDADPAQIRLREAELDGFVPSPGDRAWLLGQLRELVRRTGPEHLLVAPLIDGSEAWFPDPWHGGEASMRRLLQRLLLYAGIPDLEVEVTIEDVAPTGRVATGPSISDVTFEGQRKGVLHFGVAAPVMRLPKVLVPAAARAVAEAWRAVRRLSLSRDMSGERVVDVTAIYLGFGRLTVNASLQDHLGSMQGFTASRSRTRLGVLTPPQVSFVFAAMAVARDLSPQACKTLAKGLNPNPRAFFSTSVAILREYQPPLAQLLELPPKDQWPEPPDLEELTAPFAVEQSEQENEAAALEKRRDQDRGVLGMNEGKPVFRVVRSKALRWGRMLALPTVLLGMLSSRMEIGIEIPMWQVGVAAVALGLVGLGLGRLFQDSRCSEPSCATELSPTDTVCPRCRGTIRGVISHPKQRLAAEEALTAGEDGKASSSRPS